jgi:hypothetical protein
MMCKVAFTDIHGGVRIIEVDSAYMMVLDAISKAHAYRAPITRVMPSSMLDGDFSEQEMDLAEEIINDLGKKSRADQAIQA